MISTSSIKTSFSSECQTNARIILTNGEGLSVTACPASENAGDGNYVDIYSSGWEDSFEQRDVAPSREISIEYLYPDREEYVVTWFEMVPRVSLGLVGKPIIIIIIIIIDTYKYQILPSEYIRIHSHNLTPLFYRNSTKLYKRMSGDGCLCEFKHLVWWGQSLSIRLWWILYTLLSAAEITGRSFGRFLCSFNFGCLWHLILGLSVS